MEYTTPVLALIGQTSRVILGFDGGAIDNPNNLPPTLASQVETEW